MAADADGGANSGWETVGFAGGCDFEVEFAEGGSGLDPGGVGGGVEVDGAEVEHVEDDEGGSGGGGVGDAIEIVAAAADFELDFGEFGAEDCGLDVGVEEGGDDEERFWGGGGVEAAVADVGLEDGWVRWVGGSVDYGGDLVLWS